MKRFAKWTAGILTALALAGSAQLAFAQPEPGHASGLRAGGPITHPHAASNGETPETASKGEESEESAEGGPKAINWFDFDNKTQIPYAVYVLNFAILIFGYY